MADRSAIEWTESTWNPVTGCSKVSPGCAHCYAERIELRFGRSTKPWTSENAEENVRLHPERLDQPLRWRRPRMVFVNSMSDLFHEQVPDEYIDKVLAVMALAPQHTFQILTKRPERARAYFGEMEGGEHWPECWADEETLTFALSRGSHYSNGSHRPWPLPNVWLGVSIENARHTWRADVLREIPAAVRFISAEPLLGSLLESPGEAEYNTRRDGKLRAEWGRKPLDLTDIDWVIVGGESGPHARPMHPEWARELRDGCLACCALCTPHSDLDAPACHHRPAFFFKQWGGKTAKAGGRLLDGCEWNEMPCTE